MATNDQLVFKTAARARTPITFTIDEAEYHFTPPNTTAIVLPIIDDAGEGQLELNTLRASLEWVGAGLPDDEEAELLGRLRDPDDDLDLGLLMDVVKALLVRTAGAPLAVSAGSSE